MDTDGENTTDPLVSHVLVPVAGEADARATAGALRSYAPERVTVVYVVEKGGGVPDKTPVEQSEEMAEEAFAAFRETFPDADTEVEYGRDVVGTIHDLATDIGASAIAFRPREGGRLVRFLSGDRSLKLVTEAEIPVIALPQDGT